MSKLLSQGGFGCVYYPGINCKGKTINTKNVVTKLQSQNFNSDNEVNVGNIIKNIYFFKNFFLPVINTCPIDIRLMDRNLIEECEIIKDTKHKYILMNIPYVSNTPFNDIFKIGEDNKKHFFLQLTETFTYLVSSIKKLVEYKVVHFDLKNDNILYNSITKDPQIIDFGISIPIDNLNDKNLKEHFYIYAPEYYIWPLEVHIIGYILYETDKTLTIDDAKKISDEYVNNNKALSIFSLNFRNLYKNSCEKVISQYINKPRNIVIDKLISFYKTWDNYSISIVFLKLFDYIFSDGFFKNDFLIDFSKILLFNINPDPSKRLDLDETIKQFNDIFYKEGDINTYLEITRDINIDSKNTIKIIDHEMKEIRQILKKN